MTSHLEQEMKFLIRVHKFTIPEMEYKFHPVRRWRFDFAWPSLMLAVEVEGGTWGKVAGRHNRGSGFEQDCEKYNTAALLGWRVLRFTDKMIKSGMATQQIEIALRGNDGHK